MEGLTPSVWFPVATLVIGAVLKAVFDSLTEKRRAKFDRESRLEKRKEIILLQRIDLQRKALGDSQLAIAELVRCTALVNISDAKSRRDDGNWGHGLLGEELNERYRSASQQVALTKVRVRDGAVRDMASLISQLCAGVALAKSQSESDDLVQQAGYLSQEFNELIGKTLRALEDEEQALLV